MSLLKSIQLDVPELAGEPSPEMAEMLKQESDATVFGAPFMAGSIAVSTWHYGGDEVGEEFCVGFRIVCLAASAPITIEILRLFDDDDSEDSLSSLCLCLCGESESYCLDHPITRSVLSFFEITDEKLVEAMSESSSRQEKGGLSEYDTPGGSLMMYLLDEPLRTDGAQREAALRTKEVLQRGWDQERQLARRDQRKQVRQIESLEQQLATARAVADRERVKTRSAESRLRVATSPSGTAPIAGTAGAASGDDGVRRELEARLEAATARIEQLGGELDDAKEQVYQLRLRLPAEADSQEEAATFEEGPKSAPRSFDEMEGWLAEWVAADRVFIHPKAIRSAKKSVFKDAGLVCRVLHALGEHYWPMKMQGDEAAGKRWAAFLQEERLTCGPTGAAASTHRTIDSYQVQFGGRRYPLDMHVQGSSSRKEQDGLRLYFHPCRERERILVGHFPTHLPNTLS